MGWRSCCEITGARVSGKILLRQLRTKGPDEARRKKGASHNGRLAFVAPHTTRALMQRIQTIGFETSM
jgi:hypothetical protein